MNERLAKVLEYENRLMHDRQQLQRLIAESDGNDAQLVKEKLEFFTQEIAYLNRQVQTLKAELDAKSVTQSVAMQMPQDVQRPTQQPAQQVQQPAQRPAQPIIQPTYVQAAPASPKAQVVSQAVQHQKQEQPKKSPVAKADWESAIGKSLMGIFASVLIFIGLILFATVLVPFFGNIGKMCITFMVSFVFLAVGLSKLKKYPKNKFFLALTGCGVGALYISLLLGNIYYKVIGDIVLYLLILLWGAAVCALSRMQEKLFQIIGHLGITISVIFGCVLCMQTEDVLKFTILIVFYLITSVIFYVAHYHREIMKNLIFFIFNAINHIFLVPCAAYVFGDGFSVSALILLFAVVVTMGLLLWSKTEEYGVSFALLFSIALWEFWGVLHNIIVPGENVTGAVLMFVIAMAWIGILQYKEIKGNIGKYIPQGWLLFMALGAIFNVEFLELYGYVPLFILPVLAIGFLCRNPFFKYTAPVLMFFYLFKDMDFAILHVLLAGAGLVAMYGLMFWKKEQYQAAYKYILHTVTLFYLWIPLRHLLEDVFKLLQIKGDNINGTHTLVFAVVVAFNLLMMKYPFGNNLKTGAKERPVYHYIINLIFMLVGTGAVRFGENDFWHLLTVLITLITFVVNSKDYILKYAGPVLLGIYLLTDVDVTILHLMFAGVGLVVMYGMMLREKEHYQAVYKYILHTVTMAFLWLFFGQMLEGALKQIPIKTNWDDIAGSVTLTVVVAFNLLMMKYPFGNNLKTGAKETPAYHYIVNLFYMIMGTIAIGWGENDFWHLLTILVTIVTFMVNSKNILDNRKNIFGGMYVGVKFTILMVVILTSFDAANYVISIACFVLAIISIVLGFTFQYKTLRIYGLILSMISTFKLIMIDISYDNSMGNAISFLVAGVLCFAISLIYNLIDNRLNKKSGESDSEK